MSKNKKRLVPVRRFKEFENSAAWEQRRLGEVVDFIGTGKSHYNLKEIGKYEILGSTGIIGYDDSYDYEGNFLLTARVGANAGTIYRHSGKVKITDNTVFLKATQLNFVYSLLKKFDLKRLSFGSGQPLIKSSELKQLKISIPTNIEEQQKIGLFFQQFDSLIALHQRKLDKLKRIKSAYLTEMFPAEGEREPKRRFPGFTGAWEQRKLGEIATFSKGTGYSKQDLESNGNPIILYGRMYTNYELVIHSVNTFTIAKEKSIYSNGGEVIVPASGETAEDISVASVVEQANVLLGGDLNIIHTNKNVEPVFLALSITNGEPHKDMAKRAQGKSVVHLHNSDLAQIKLSYPSKDEQKKIDSYFLKFNSLIALHQRKLDKLKKLKAAYLNEMFV